MCFMKKIFILNDKVLNAEGHNNNCLLKSIPKFPLEIKVK